jgi:isoamyl acetate esterase
MQTVFFGANDSCFKIDIPEKNQCVPLPQFRQNIHKIVRNPRVTEHSPYIILITPPPIDERKQHAIDITKGYPLRRSAENTKKYADAVREVAAELGIPVLDMWSRCMELAGWRPGQPLEGSKDLPPNPKFDDLFVDGKWLCPSPSWQVKDPISEVAGIAVFVYLAFARSYL